MFGAFGKQETPKEMEEILNDTITPQELEVSDFTIFPLLQRSQIMSHNIQKYLILPEIRESVYERA